MDDPASVLFSAEQLETLRGQIVEFKRLRHEVADLIALHDHTGEIQGAACRLCNTIVPWLDNSDKNLIRIIKIGCLSVVSKFMCDNFMENKHYLVKRMRQNASKAGTPEQWQGLEINILKRIGFNLGPICYPPEEEEKLHTPVEASTAKRLEEEGTREFEPVTPVNTTQGERVYCKRKSDNQWCVAEVVRTSSSEISLSNGTNPQDGDDGVGNRDVVSTQGYMVADSNLSHTQPCYNPHRVLKKRRRAERSVVLSPISDSDGELD